MKGNTMCRGEGWIQLQKLLAVALLTASALVFWAVAADNADADVAIHTFEVHTSTTQAGGHPDVVIEFTNGTRVDPETGDPCHCNALKDAKVSLPAGFIGNPHATPRCSSAEFAQDQCPIDSQVGVVHAGVIPYSECCYQMTVPLYNVEPLPNQAGLLGFKAFLFNFPIYTVISARTDSDYGLDAKVVGANQTFGVAEFKQILWGVPASASNDGERYTSGGASPGSPPAVSNSPEIPFLQNPTTCSGPLEASLEILAYDHGITHATAPWPETTGCDQLTFNPSLAAQPSTQQADTASGLDVRLDVPQILSTTTPSPSQIKSATLTLPEGFSINPNAADGKTSCSDAEAGIGTTLEARCPENSKVGTVELVSTALPGPLPGAVYLGTPRPDDRYRVIVTAEGYATNIKLIGSIAADPETGQMVASFEDLPQAPFSKFEMHFFGSERGLLATPERCGTYPVHTEFVPWNSVLPDQTSTQFFHIKTGPGGGPCPDEVRRFAPGLEAASSSNGSGIHTPFSFELKRDDGDQVIETIKLTTPPGFSATLRGVVACPDSTLTAIAESGSGQAELAASGCPAQSQVGTAAIGAGAGTHQVYFPSRIFLAGPYKGSPLSLAFVTPAVSGPYDLGNIVVRNAIEIDPGTAQITNVSDPLPRIVEGIPLRLRTIRADLDRPDFTLNPTNCDPFSVDGLFGGGQGSLAALSTHFQVSSCDVLDFSPKIVTTLSGSTKRLGYPALKTVVTTGSGRRANIGRAAVTLPRTQMLDNARLSGPCTRPQFAARQCPSKSVLGTATAITPMLDQPLSGPVYLRVGSNKLPDLVAALEGPASQPIRIELVGRIDSVKGSLRTTFGYVPDVEVERFTLNLLGGKRGLLRNTVSLCAKPTRVKAVFVGQNGKRANLRPTLKAPCKGAARSRANTGKGRSR